MEVHRSAALQAHRHAPSTAAGGSLRQIVPGSFEHALAHLIDHELDLSAFEARFRNDTTGAAAYPPGVLLKIVLLAYSRGIMSSGAIEAGCRQNVLFMAISSDTQLHFTTIAQFIKGTVPVNYWLHPEARDDLRDAADFYLGNASAALSQALLAEFENSVGLLLEHSSRAAQLTR